MYSKEKQVDFKFFLLLKYYRKRRYGLEKNEGGKE